MKKDYLDNMNKILSDNNRYALSYGDGKAWDNKKKKTMKSQMPRGKVYRRLSGIEFDKIINQTNELARKLITDGTLRSFV